MMKLKKGKLLIDQHNKNYMYGRKFGGNYVPETLKKPIEDLTNLFEKLRYDKKFLKLFLIIVLLLAIIQKPFGQISFQDYPPNLSLNPVFLKFSMLFQDFSH